MNPSPTHLLLDAVELAIAAGDHETALRLAITNLQRVPRLHLLRYLMAIVHTRVGQIDGALQLAHATFRLARQDGDLLAALLALRLLGELGDATAPLQTTLLEDLRARGMQVRGDPDPPLDPDFAGTRPPLPFGPLLAVARELGANPPEQQGVPAPFLRVPLLGNPNNEAVLVVLDQAEVVEREPGETLLLPPLVSAAWIVAGQIGDADGTPFHSPPGTLVHLRDCSQNWIAISTVRMIALDQDAWDDLLHLPGAAELLLRDRWLDELDQALRTHARRTGRPLDRILGAEDDTADAIRVRRAGPDTPVPAGNWLVGTGAARRADGTAVGPGDVLQGQDASSLRVERDVTLLRLASD